MTVCPSCGFAQIPSMLRKCPRCQRILPDLTDQEPEGTRLESVETIRRWMEQGVPVGQSMTAPSKSETEIPEDGTEPFHPFQRPPLALLCIADDGSQSGQWIRIRLPEVVIGRTEGDILISHDEAISGRHCAIYRTAQHGRWQWRIRDLDSSNGTFVRVSAAVLKPEHEILLGGSRFRFESGADANDAANQADQAGRNVTRAWQVPSLHGSLQSVPALVELTPSGEGARYGLAGQEHWLGSSPDQCDIVIKNDPFVSKQHAQLCRDKQGRWQIRDAKSRNGTWLRIQEIAVRSVAEFQAGEQRFLLRIPSGEN